ncbi:MAG: 2-oxoglutarate dehydrogenase E2 component (dihydrolipoamide succinyltransferase), partial [Oleispira sp.]
MSVEIKAPVFPESVADGTIATWHKQPGEAVSRDELLVDIETDKVVLEVVAQNDGVLTQILKAEGDTVLSAEVIAIYENGGAGSAPVAVEAAAPVVQEASRVDGKVNPAAKKLAEEKDIDLSKVTASGKDGRITKEDVINYIKAVPAQAPAPVVAAPEPTPKPAALAPLNPMTSFSGGRIE